MIAENLDYRKGIIKASQNSLLIINYELFIDNIQKAIRAIEKEDYHKFGETMIIAHKLHRELTNDLDMSYEIFRQLLSLYIYVNKRMIEASMDFSKEPLEEVFKVMSILLDGWEQAEKEEASTMSLIENAKKLYTGLICGRGSLNESIYSTVAYCG